MGTRRQMERNDANQYGSGRIHSIDKRIQTVAKTCVGASWGILSEAALYRIAPNRA